VPSLIAALVAEDSGGAQITPQKQELLHHELHTRGYHITSRLCVKRATSPRGLGVRHDSRVAFWRKRDTETTLQPLDVRR